MAWKPALAVLCLALAAAAQATTTVLPPGAVLVELDTWKPDPTGARGAAASALQKIGRGDASGALADLAALQAPAQFEPAAANLIDSLQQGNDTPAVRAVLEGLSREPVRLFHRHPETAADWFVPLYDIASRAQSALALLDRKRAVAELVARLQREPQATLEAEPKADELAAALAILDGKSLAQLEALALADRVTLPGSAWAQLAQRRPSLESFEAVLSKATPVDVLSLLPEAVHRLDPDSAVGWLERVAADPELASAAVLSLGRLAATEELAMQSLAKHLGDPDTGSSAAAALARLDRPDRLERIESLATLTEKSAVLRDLALALRLEGSAPALAQLKRLASDPRLPASVKAELQP